MTQPMPPAIDLGNLDQVVRSGTAPRASLCVDCSAAAPQDGITRCLPCLFALADDYRDHGPRFQAAVRRETSRLFDEIFRTCMREALDGGGQ